MITRPLTQFLLAGFALSAVAVGQNSPADGSFQVRYASNLTTQVTSTIYSTGGVPPTFGATGYALATGGAPACTSLGTLAFKFQAQVTAPLQTVQVAVFAQVTPPTSATFRLKDDNLGTPGADIEVFSFPLTTTAAIQTATSVLHPVLTAGTFYWLWADTPACNQRYGWFVASPSVPGTASDNGSPGGPTSQVAAFALTGLSGNDSQITFTNAGANNAGDICVNAYVFAPDEQLVSCCSCKVTRNALQSAFVGRDMTSNTLTPAKENSVVIKLLATAAPVGACDAANPGAPAQGLAAWANTFHLSNGTTGQLFASETPFTNSTLSAAERNVMTSLCGFIKSNGSGYGICNICQTNGAVHQ